MVSDYTIGQRHGEWGFDVVHTQTCVTAHGRQRADSGSLGLTRTGCAGWTMWALIRFVTVVKRNEQ
jgi:hypothetical protein